MPNHDHAGLFAKQKKQNEGGRRKKKKRSFFKEFLVYPNGSLFFLSNSPFLLF